MWYWVISERNHSVALRGRSGQLVGSKGKLTGPECPVQLQDGSLESFLVIGPAGHQRREKSNAASGRPWMNSPPQFFVRDFVAFANSGERYDCSGAIFVVTS
jgi:hypothetical protein